MSDSPLNAKQEEMLLADLADPFLSENPYNFVMYAFPWGKEGTPLARYSGPRPWQKEALLEIAEHVQKNKALMEVGLSPELFRLARASGRGPGKSALCAWLILWLQSCHIGSTVIVTANTEPQLKGKTWAELGKWHTLSINRHWFDRQALSMKPAPWFADLVKEQLNVDPGYYYASAQLWSEENPDAFVGAHNPHGLMYIFDEASGIPAPIWDAVPGSFTEPCLHGYWLAFSNPRRNTGAFFDCFHKYRSMWNAKAIDARTAVENKTELENIIRQYGPDSDQARIEVYGEFPHQGDKQFISREIVDGAQHRQLEPDDWAPLYMGVDPARFGDDMSVIRFRRGRDARSIPVYRFKGVDNMKLANECARLIDKYQPDAVCIDAGNGTGVIDRLRELKYKVHEVWFGAKSPEPEWGNQSTWLWAQMREWLKGACIDDDRFLRDDLVNREYKFVGTSDTQRLESKEELKRRHLPSPDDADALACTFAVRVPRLDSRTRRRGGQPVKQAADLDYPVFG